MNKIFGSLEELDDVTDVNDEAEVKDVDLDEITFKLMEADELIEDANKDLEATNDKMDELEATVERLEVLTNVIKKHGINQAIMEVADPFNELVDAGICCSYEELSIELSYGVHAATTISNIDASIEGLWDKIVDIFKSIGNKIKDYSIKQEKANMIYTTALLDIKETIESISDFDTSKFESKSVRAYTKEHMKQGTNAISAVSKVVDGNAIDELFVKINGFNKALDKATNEAIDAEFIKYCKVISALNNDKKTMEMVGFRIDVDADHKISGIKRVPVSIEDNRATVKELGWSVDAVKHLINDVIVLLNKTYGYANALSSLADHYDSEAHISYQTTVKKDTPEEHKKILKKMYITIKKGFGIQYAITYGGIFVLRNVASSTLELARAAVASKA